jgi:hypothetical protein
MSVFETPLNAGGAKNTEARSFTGDRSERKHSKWIYLLANCRCVLDKPTVATPHYEAMDESGGEYGLGNPIFGSIAHPEAGFVHDRFDQRAAGRFSHHNTSFSGIGEYGCFYQKLPFTHRPTSGRVISHPTRGLSIPKPGDQSLTPFQERAGAVLRPDKA